MKIWTTFLFTAKRTDLNWLSYDHCTLSTNEIPVIISWSLAAPIKISSTSISHQIFFTHQDPSSNFQVTESWKCCSDNLHTWHIVINRRYQTFEPHFIATRVGDCTKWLVDCTKWLGNLQNDQAYHWLKVYSRRANNGVSRYPSYQKNFQLAENFQNIYRTLSKLNEFPLNFLSIL